MKSSYKPLSNKALFSLMIIVLMTLSPGLVRAHQFSLVFVAPLSGENIETGQQAVDGFMLATEEQDGHDFEESDGHLGGLDSYVFTLDSAQEPKAILEQLGGLIETQQPAFITGLFDSTTAKLLVEASDGKNVVLLNPDESNLWQSNKNAPQNLVMVNGLPFLSAMRSEFSYAPGASAYRGYIAARLISSAVRSLAQNPAEDISTTAKAVKHAQKSM